MRNNENAKERKSFKEVVVENKGKIIAGVSIVAAGAVGVVLVKNNKDLLKYISKVEAKSDLGNIVDKELWEKVEVTEDIIINSGIVDQARATIMRKRDTLISNLNCLQNMDQINDSIVDKISKLKGGISGFDKMLDQCDLLEHLYKCRSVGEKIYWEE